MQVTPEYMTRVLNEDFKSLLDKRRAYAERPQVQEYIQLDTDIKALKGQIGDDMLNLFRTYGIQSIKSDVATAYVKEEYAILRDRLTPAQIIAMFDYNPDAFKVTDKALRDTIEAARKAYANGDLSDGVRAILGLDLDRLRGPAKYSAVIREAKY